MAHRHGGMPGGQWDIMAPMARYQPCLSDWLTTWLKHRGAEDAKASQRSFLCDPLRDLRLCVLPRLSTNRICRIARNGCRRPAFPVCRSDNFGATAHPQVVGAEALPRAERRPPVQHELVTVEAGTCRAGGRCSMRRRSRIAVARASTKGVLFLRCASIISAP